MALEPPKTPRSVAGVTELMEKLRGPDGCPWDREQTHASIAPYCIEEAYEVVDAIDRGDDEDLRDELGDLLLQVVFHAQMAEARGAFTLDDVCEALVTKMVRRHPHVFGEAEGVDWEAAKAAERAEKGRKTGEAESALSGVPVGLPALTRAEKIGKRAGRAGFDWAERRDVIAKIREELDEVEAALDGPEDELAAEVGDVLFACAMLTRKLGLQGETLLRAANEKFARRFEYLEERAAESGRAFADHSLVELEAFWTQAKQAGL